MLDAHPEEKKVKLSFENCGLLDFIIQMRCGLFFLLFFKSCTRQIRHIKTPQIIIPKLIKFNKNEEFSPPKNQKQFKLTEFNLVSEVGSNLDS